MEERITHKSTTILISTGSGQLAKFRSLHEVPAKLRQRLWQSTAGPYSATLLIADEAGRHEILRSLRPSGEGEASSGPAMPSAFQSAANPARFRDTNALQSRTWNGKWRHAAELALLGGIGLCLWLLASWR